MPTTTRHQVPSLDRTNGYDPPRTSDAPITEMRAVCQLGKLDRDGGRVLAGHWFNRQFGRKVSIYISRFMLRRGLKPTHVTVAWILTGLCGVALCIPHQLWMTVLGAFLIPFTIVLDCCDGEMARWTRSSSLRGMFLDLVGHIFVRPAISAICGLHLYVGTGSIDHLLLAIVAHAAAQWRLGVRHAFIRVKLVHALSENASDPASVGPTVPLRPSGGFRRIVRRTGFAALQLPMDGVRVVIVFLIAALVAYAGSDLLLKVAAWYMAVAGVLFVLYQSVDSYFRHVPDAPHAKNLEQH